MLTYLCSVVGGPTAKAPVKYGLGDAFLNNFGELNGEAGKDLEPLRIIFLADLITSCSSLMVSASASSKLKKFKIKKKVIFSFVYLITRITDK